MNFQFTIPYLMLVTFVVAAFCNLMAPFNPVLKLRTTILPDAMIAKGTYSPVAVIQIKNLGSSSVWYRGKNGEVTSFFSASGPDEKQAVGFMTHDYYSDAITELKPGGTAFARFPIRDKGDEIYFEMEVQDWRGRTVSRSTGAIEEVLIGLRTM